jgi:hypothetical protein
MYKYSDKLIQEAIKNFKEENDLVISDEKANEYLDSLAGLFLAFADRKDTRSFNSTEVAPIAFQKK